MRLLISGSRRNTNTIGSFIIQNFDGSFAFEILEFPDRFAELLDSRIYKLMYRFFPILVIRKMDRLFVKQVERFNPTVILIFKGMEISKQSLIRIKSKGIKLVNYNFDHPFDFFSRGTGNRFVREAIPYYDLHISYSKRISKELDTQFKVRTAQIPFGFHLTAEQYEFVIAAGDDEINRACFVGNPDQLREKAIMDLLDNGIPIDLYGFGWDRIFTQPNSLLTIHMPRKQGSFWSDPLEFWKVLRRYSVQLNFFRPHNEGSHNLRTFEVPAVGGILLTPASQEQAKFFVPGEEIFFYTDQMSLLQQCQKLLQADSETTHQIRSIARIKSVEKDYSYQRRTRDILVLLNKTINKA
jgi:spore maturation protein CgeB